MKVQKKVTKMISGLGHFEEKLQLLEILCLEKGQWGIMTETHKIMDQLDG